MHPWVTIKSNKWSNVVGFNYFTIIKVIFPLSFSPNCLPHSSALWLDFYLPLFSHAWHSLNLLCISFLRDWYRPKSLDSFNRSRWGPFRQMQLSWETDHKTSFFLAHGLYELSPGISLCEYIHQGRMGDLFASGGLSLYTASIHYQKREGQGDQMLYVPVKKLIAARFCICFPSV